MKKFLLKHTNVSMSLLINGVFVIIFGVAFGSFYTSSDDWIGARMIELGYRNNVFISYFIQAINGFVQNIISPLNAFVILQLLFNFIAMTSILYVFFDCFSKKKAIICAIAVEVIFGSCFYSLLCFTHTAILLDTAGCFVLFYAYTKKKKMGFTLLGIVFCVLGSFYRIEIFYSVIAVFVAFCFARCLIPLHKPYIKSFIGVIKQFFKAKNIVILVVLFLTVFGLETISGAIINSDSASSYYREYNLLRSKMGDYEIPSYSSYKDEYEKIGISETDYKMIMGWYFDDKGASDIETLQNIAVMQKNMYGSAFKKIELSLKNMVVVELRNVFSLNSRGLMIIVFELLCITILVLYKKKSWVFVIALNIICLMLLSYLWIGGRILFRATLSFWFPSFIFLLLSTSFMEKRKWIIPIMSKRKIVFSVSSALILLLGFSMSNIFVKENTLNMERKSEDIYKYIRETDKTFMLASSVCSLRDSMSATHPFTVTESEEYKKCITFGSAYYAHPYYIDRLKEHGIENVYSDIIDNEKICYVTTIESNSIEYFTQYLNDRYSQNNNNIGYEKIAEYDGIGFYIFRTYEK